MDYNLIYKGTINEESKKFIDEKLENITVSNNGYKSTEFFKNFYDNIKILNLLTIILNNKKNKYIHKKKILNFKKEYNLYSSAINEIRVHDEFRLFNFIELHKKYKFNSVLEFGGGASTLFFDHLLKGKGKIHVFDQTPEILKKIKNKIKYPSNIKLTHSEVELITFKNEIFLKFKEIEKVYGQSFDLIYIDAPVIPNLKFYNKGHILNYVLDLIEKINYKIILFDKKYYNFHFLKENLDDRKFKLVFDYKNYSFYIKKI